MSVSGHDGASLLDLPNEVLIYDILPLLSPKDLASVSQVNQQLHALVVRDPPTPQLMSRRTQVSGASRRPATSHIAPRSHSASRPRTTRTGSSACTLAFGGRVSICGVRMRTVDWEPYPASTQTGGLAFPHQPTLRRASRRQLPSIPPTRWPQMTRSSQ